MLVLLRLLMGLRTVILMRWICRGGGLGGRYGRLVLWMLVSVVLGVGRAMRGFDSVFVLGLSLAFLFGPPHLGHYQPMKLSHYIQKIFTH